MQIKELCIKDGERIQKAKEEKDKIKKQLQNNFYFFVYTFFPFIYDQSVGTSISEVSVYKAHPLYELLAEELECVAEGQTDLLVVNLPRGTGKSIMFSILFPLWLLCRNPRAKIANASFKMQNLETWQKQRINVMRSKLFQSIFHEVVLANDNKTEIQTTRGGSVIVKSSGSGSVGTDVQMIVIDDALSDEGFSSQVVRDGVNRWYSSIAPAVRSVRGKTGIVVVMQRIHHEDLSGLILSKKEGYEKSGSVLRSISVPAIFEKQFIFDFPKTKKQLICDPKQKYINLGACNESYIKKMQVDMFPEIFDAQMMNEPRSALNGFFNKDYFRYLDHNDFMSKIMDADEVWMVLDCAYKTGEMNDNTGCVTFGVRRSNRGDEIYVIDAWAEKLTFPQLKEKVETTIGRINRTFSKDVNYLLIEDKASGTSLIQEFQNTDIARYVDIIAGGARQSKEIRMKQAMTKLKARVENGAFFLPLGLMWVGKFESELLSFPNGKHDDMVDCCSLFMNEFYSRDITYIKPFTANALSSWN